MHRPSFGFKHGVIITVTRPGTTRSEADWEALGDFILARAHESRGMLILSHGDTPGVGARTVMHATLQRARHLRVAFMTSNPLTLALVQSVIAPSLRGRLLHTESFPQAFAHLGVPSDLAPELNAEIDRLITLATPSVIARPAPY
jgi:hypothetical protein